MIFSTTQQPDWIVRDFGNGDLSPLTAGMSCQFKVKNLASELFNSIVHLQNVSRKNKKETLEEITTKIEVLLNFIFQTSNELQCIEHKLNTQKKSLKQTYSILKKQCKDNKASLKSDKLSLSKTKKKIKQKKKQKIETEASIENANSTFSGVLLAKNTLFGEKSEELLNILEKTASLKKIKSKLKSLRNKNEKQEEKVINAKFELEKLKTSRYFQKNKLSFLRKNLKITHQVNINLSNSSFLLNEQLQILKQGKSQKIQLLELEKKFKESFIPESLQFDVDKMIFISETRELTHQIIENIADLHNSSIEKKKTGLQQISEIFQILIDLIHSTSQELEIKGSQLEKQMIDAARELNQVNIQCQEKIDRISVLNIELSGLKRKEKCYEKQILTNKSKIKAGDEKNMKELNKRLNLLSFNSFSGWLDGAISTLTYKDNTDYDMLESKIKKFHFKKSELNNPIKKIKSLASKNKEKVNKLDLLMIQNENEIQLLGKDLTFLRNLKLQLQKIEIKYKFLKKNGVFCEKIISDKELSDKKISRLIKQLVAVELALYSV